jgi:hypothetical protein
MARLRGTVRLTLRARSGPARGSFVRGLNLRGLLLACGLLASGAVARRGLRPGRRLADEREQPAHQARSPGSVFHRACP